jgi:AbrB family looped-hinge helix DNA binding protein
MGAKGQVVIPKELRDRLNMHPGAEVEFAVEDDHVLVLPRRRGRSLAGRLGGPDMASRLLDDRAREPR